MMSSRKPISFIATSDPDAARSFYADVIGLELVESSPYALVFSDGGHMLRVQIVADFQAPPYTAHGWQVTYIDGTIAELTAKGAHFEQFDQLDQSPEGVWKSPGGPKIAWMKDPAGNILSLSEFQD